MKFFRHAFLLFIGCISVVFAEEVSDKCQMAKTETCVACHGEDGNSMAPLWPKLAGQHEDYLVKQLKDFRLGEAGPRYEPSMYGMVVTLSDDDILLLAQCYSSKKQTGGKAAAAFVERGEKIYRGGLPHLGVSACIACHGPRGSGNDLAGFPKISGQNAEYTAQQLKGFREGKRANDVNAIMRDISMRMNDEDIQAVSEYIAGLH